MIPQLEVRLEGPLTLATPAAHMIFGAMSLFMLVAVTLILENLDAL